jgi:hypothetical protein
MRQRHVCIYAYKSCGYDDSDLSNTERPISAYFRRHYYSAIFPSYSEEAIHINYGLATSIII